MSERGLRIILPTLSIFSLVSVFLVRDLVYILSDTEFFGVATQTRYVDCLNNTKKTFHASIMTRTCLVLYTESASMKRRETKIDSNSDKETVRVSSWTAFDDTYVRYVCDSARTHTHTHTHTPDLRNACLNSTSSEDLNSEPYTF